MRSIPAIDGLRAIAVLAVIAYHVGLPVHAGFVGVDMFFVISGYLITGLLTEELRASGRIDFAAFYARRVRRLLPALVVVVVVTLLLSKLLLSPLGEQQAVAKAAAASLLFSSNFWVQAVSSDYWDAAVETMPLLHLWSLGVEEQFYLVWPLLLIMFFGRTRIALAIVAVASFALTQWLLAAHPQTAFFQMPPRMWELCSGGFVALSKERSPRAFAWVGLALVLGACFVPLDEFPGLGALPAVAGSALLIHALQSGARVPMLEARPVVFVGLISYSLYLWHWPLLAFDRASEVSPLPVRLGLCLIAFAAAAASYRYVERPFRGMRGSNARFVFAGSGAAALLACAGFALGRQQVPMTPVLSRAQQVAADHPDRAACEYGADETSAVFPKSACNSHRAQVVIWGDSYGFAWQPFARELAQRDGLSAIAFTRSNCSPLTGVALPKRNQVESTLCSEFNAKVGDWIVEHDVKVVILAGRWLSNDNANAELGLGASIAKIGPHVVRIYVIGPTPELPETVPRCIEQGIACGVSRQKFEFDAIRSRAMMARMGQLAKVEIIDPTEFLCTSTLCPGERGGLALYFDGNHASSSAVKAFAKLWLDKVGIDNLRGATM